MPLIAAETGAWDTIGTLLLAAGAVTGLASYWVWRAGRSKGDSAGGDTISVAGSPGASAQQAGGDAVGRDKYEAGRDIVVHPPSDTPTSPLDPPHIKFPNHQFGEGALWWPELPGKGFKALIVVVANDPPPGVKAESAEDVCAYLTIELPDGSRPLEEVQARWVDKPKAGRVGKYHVNDSPVTKVVLPPNGAAFGIATILYLRNEEEIWAYTEAGPEKEIKGETFDVHVRVRGSNMDKTTRYRIERTPENPFDGFQVTPVSLMRVAVEPPAYDQENPYSLAHKLQRGADTKGLRRAMRCIAEDELANLVKPRLKALLDRKATSMELATAQWTIHHETVRDMDDQRPYRAGARAYRLLVDLHKNLALENRTKKLAHQEIVDVHEAYAAADDALAVFREYQP